MAVEEQISNEQLFSSDDPTPKTNKPTPQVNGDVSFEQTLKANFPEYKGTNSLYLRKQLNEDDKFFGEVAQKMYMASIPEDQFQQLITEDREKFDAGLNVFKKNLRSYVTNMSHSGETPEQSLIKRSVDITDENIPLQDYADVVNKNKNKYKRLGLIDEDGEFVYGSDPLSFQKELQSNKQLHAEIESDRFSEFTTELGQRHNNIKAFQDPSELTKAWVVYDRQGSEALTQYVNAIQATESIASGAEKRQQAQEYLQNVKIGDESLNEYYERYVVGEVKDTQYGRQIARAAYDAEIDPALLSGLIEQESAFNANAISSAGAVGLTQMMPTTARENGLRVPQELYELDKKRVNSRGELRERYAKELAKRTKELGIDPEKDERYNPDKAIQATTKYFKNARKKFDDTDSLIASYHQGITGVENAHADSVQTGQDWRELIGPKGRDYVTKVKQKSLNYEDKVDRGLVFNPVTPNKELQTNTPKDLNNYNADKYEQNGELKDFETWVRDNVPEGVNASRLVEDQALSEEYSKLTQDMYRTAMSGEGDYNVEDLMETLMGAQQYVREDEQGEPVYGLNYNNMNWQQQMAFDALSHDNEFSYMIEDLGDGKYNYKPNMRGEALSAWGDVFGWLQNTKTEFVPDGNGGFEKVESPDDGFLAGVQNSVATLLMGGASEVMQYAFTPMARGYNALAEATGVGEDFARQAVNVTNKLAGVDPSADLTTADSHGTFVAGVGEVAPFAWYMASMFGLGKAAIKGIGSVAGSITKSKQTLDAIKLGHTMKGSPKFAAMADKLAKGVANKAPWTVGTGVFYTGGAIKESLTPSERSFYNVVPQLFGYDQTNDVSTLYNNTNAIGKVGMDVAGSLVFDLFADTIIASARFGGEKGLQKFFNKKSFNGVKWDEAKGSWKVVDTPQFKHDLREFWSNLTTGLADKPMGDVGRTMAKSMAGDLTPETMHDAVKIFTDKTSDVASNIQGEIRKNIQHVQNTLGDGVKLADDEIDRMVNEQYGQFVENVAETLTTTLRTSGDTSLPLRFADAMEQQLPRIKKRDDIKPNQAGYHREQLGENIIVKDGEVFEIDDKFWAVDVAQRMRKKAFEADREEIIDRKVREAGISRDNPQPDDAERIAQISQRVDETIGTAVDIDGNIGYVVDFDDAGFTIRTGNNEIKKVTKLRNQLDPEDVNRRLMEKMRDRNTRQILEQRRSISTELRPEQERRPLGLPARGETAGQDIPLPPNMRQQPSSEQLPLALPEPKYARGVAGDTFEMEQGLVSRINAIDNEITNLRNRYRNMDMIEYDDSTRRGVVRRQINREIEDLQAQKKEQLSDLAQFYQRNPEVQASRLREITEAEIEVELNTVPPRKEDYPTMFREDGSRKYNDTYVDGVRFSIDSNNEKVLGAVPFNESIESYGMATRMTPKEFLSLNPTRRDVENVSIIKERITSGDAVGVPFVKATWIDEDKAWLVKGHEGRGRMLAVGELIGEKDVPVHIFTNPRPRDMTPEMKNTFKVLADKSSYVGVTTNRPFYLKEALIDGEIKLPEGKKNLGKNIKMEQDKFKQLAETYKEISSKQTRLPFC